jgi:ABC-type multidrug transport system fused ATPase/permease subunit
MEKPASTRVNRVAMVYALLLWLLRVFAAQLSVLALWYGRRCYERSRGELMMMIYEKAISRKVIVSLEERKIPPPNSDHVANGSAAETTNGTTNDANGTAVNANGSTANKHKDSKDKVMAKMNPAKATSRWKLFKELFAGHSEEEAKLKGPASTGQVLNLVRTDAYDIAQRFLEIEKFIKIPFGIIFYVALIWLFLGPSCLIGSIVIMIAQVLNGLLARVAVKWRRYLKKATDTRIQANSQFIESLRHLRWYAWHDKWLDKVMATRRHELNIRIVSIFINLASYYINVLSGQVFPVAAFFAYTALAGHELSIDLIFPALTLFGDLQRWLREIPPFITTLLNAWVAMERIESFMKEPDKDSGSWRAADVGLENAPGPPSAPELEMVLKECSFAWPGTVTPVLKEIDLKLTPGLTVVVGKIGSGKTALLLGLLGELDRLAGECEVPDETIGYCAQKPWLQSMSIRDNILFFAPYEEERYQSVIEACALQPDLELFKDRDFSHIGEK